MTQIVTPDFLAALFTGYRAIFQNGLDAQGDLEKYLKIATVFKSETLKETYSWLGAAPSLSEFLDERKTKGIKAYDYTLTNRKFEATVSVDRDTIEDERYNQIKPRIAALPRRAYQKFNSSVFVKLEAGTADLAYDGQAFFKTNRTIAKSGTLDNLKSGAYSGSATEILSAIALGYSTMATFKDDQGEYLGLVPDTIICSPFMAPAIENALAPGVAGVIRPENKIVKTIIADPDIDADVDDWYLACTTADVKPVIFQLRTAPEFTALDDPKGETAFMREIYYYGVRTRFEVGYGDPRTCIKFHDQ